MELLVSVARVYFVDLILFQIKLAPNKFTQVREFVTWCVELLADIIYIHDNFFLLKIIQHLFKLFSLHLLSLLLSVDFVVSLTDFS